MDHQFVLSTIANAIGGFVAGIAVALTCVASKTIGRAIVSWTASTLPRCPDTERTREELQGLIEEMGSLERATFAVDLLLRSAPLKAEISESAAACPTPRGRRDSKHERAAEFLSRLRRLDPGAEAILRLRYLDNKADDEIASTLGLSARDVVVTRQKALARLRRFAA